MRVEACRTCGFPIRAGRSGLRNLGGKEMRNRMRGVPRVVGHLDLPSSSSSFDVIDVERQR